MIEAIVASKTMDAAEQACKDGIDLVELYTLGEPLPTAPTSADLEAVILYATLLEASLMVIQTPATIDNVRDAARETAGRWRKR